MNSLSQDLKAILRVPLWYIKRKIHRFAINFEGIKNLIVLILMKRRGALQKPVWHGSMIGLASVGMLTSGIIGGTSIVSSAYPGVSGPDPRFIAAFEPYPNGTVLGINEDTQTDASEASKQRAETIDYEVQNGDTLSGIAKKFSVSADTIKWANDLSDVNAVKPGQTLKILPVTGISHVVKSGDTLDSIAKKYQAEPQAILDFPWNDVPDDFSLKSGQVLIIPDGVKPESAVTTPKKAQPQYLAQGPSSPTFQAQGGGSFVWPTQGIITQYFAWYHPGIDIANRAAPPVGAADGGVVIVAGWPDNSGYGNRVVIDHGNGYQTLYAHLSNIYVTAGQRVSRGQVIGQMGSTGRSTGTHLHFEIHIKGASTNPLAILK